MYVCDDKQQSPLGGGNNQIVVYNFSLLIDNILLLENIIKKVVHTFKKGAICVSKCSPSIRNRKFAFNNNNLLNRWRSFYRQSLRRQFNSTKFILICMYHFEPHNT